jgi:hypothetical protein
VQEIVDGMKSAIPKLEFNLECFKLCRHVNVEVMEVVRVLLLFVRSFLSQGCSCFFLLPFTPVPQFPAIDSVYEQSLDRNQEDTVCVTKRDEKHSEVMQPTRGRALLQHGS